MPTAARKPADTHLRDKPEVSLYHFDYAITGTAPGLAPGKVDHANGIIRGVAIITNGVTARGHDLQVDDTTLDQLLSLAKKKGKVSVKLDHGSGVDRICGFLTNFKIRDKKLVGDWHLLKSHKEYETMMERADTMAECFGMSAAFMGGGVTMDGDPVFQGEDGKDYKRIKGIKTLLKEGEMKYARATELRAVDCVTDPAANPDGLFSTKEPGVDTRKSVMPGKNSATQTAEEPSLADLMALLTEVKGGITDLNTRMEAVEAGNGPAAPRSPELDPSKYTLGELDEMTDESLAQLGITREKVDVAIAQAQGEIDAAAAEAGTGGDQPGGAAAPAGATAATVALSAEVKRLGGLVELMAKEKNREKRAAAEAELNNTFDVLEQKFSAAEDLIKEQQSTIEALQLSMKTNGGRAVRTGQPEQILFSEKAKSQAANGTWAQIVQVKFDELKGKAGYTELKAKSEAIDFGVRYHKAEYAAHRQAGGKLVIA